MITYRELEERLCRIQDTAIPKIDGMAYWDNPQWKRIDAIINEIRIGGAMRMMGLDDVVKDDFLGRAIIECSETIEQTEILAGKI